MSGRSISTTSLKICRDRRVGKTRTPDDDLRDSLTGGSQPNSTPGSPRPNAPAGRHLVARRRRSTPPKNHLPAEGPSLRPSLALDIDPAPVHALTHITPPPASRTGPNPILFQLQPPPTHPHHPVLTSSPTRLYHHTCTSSSQTNTLHFLQPQTSPLYLIQSSQPLVCIIYRPWDELQLRRVQVLQLLKPKEPSPVPHLVQDLVCSSSRPRPRVCS